LGQLGRRDRARRELAVQAGQPALDGLDEPRGGAADQQVLGGDDLGVEEGYHGGETVEHLGRPEQQGLDGEGAHQGPHPLLATLGEHRGERRPEGGGRGQEQKVERASPRRRRVGRAHHPSQPTLAAANRT
jgi:hypothetical protein